MILMLRMTPLAVGVHRVTWADGDLVIADARASAAWWAVADIRVCGDPVAACRAIMSFVEALGRRVGSG